MSKQQKHHGGGTFKIYQEDEGVRPLRQKRVSFGGENRKVLEEITNVTIPPHIPSSKMPPPVLKSRGAVVKKHDAPSREVASAPAATRPQSIVALFGMPRAGSAWLFNAARLLLKLQGSDVRAEWDTSFSEKYGSGDFSKAMERLKLVGVTALVKSLHCTHEIMAWSDRSFLCIRDVRQAVLADMNHKGTLMAPAEEWVQRAQGFVRMCNAAELEACQYPGHMFRMSYEELLRDPSAMLTLAANHLGIPKLPKDDTESGVEHLSRAVELEHDLDIKTFATKIRAIEADAECRRWLLVHGYPVDGEFYSL